MNRGILAVLPTRMLRNSTGIQLKNHEFQHFAGADSVMYIDDHGNTNPKQCADNIAAAHKIWTSTTHCEETIVATRANPIRLSTRLPSLNVKFVRYAPGDSIHVALERLACAGTPHFFDDAWGLLTANDKATGFCCDGAARARHVIHREIEAILRDWDSDAALSPDQALKFNARIDYATAVLSINANRHAAVLGTCVQLKNVVGSPGATPRAIAPSLEAFMAEVAGGSHQ